MATKAKATESSLTAAELIARVNGAGIVLPPPSSEALEQLRKVLEYNDSGRGKRVGQIPTIRMLQSYGWQGRSDTALDRLCRTHFGRQSFRSAK